MDKENPEIEVITTKDLEELFREAMYGIFLLKVEQYRILKKFGLILKDLDLSEEEELGILIRGIDYGMSDVFDKNDIAKPEEEMVRDTAEEFREKAKFLAGDG